jgi:hypothetical protein
MLKKLDIMSMKTRQEIIKKLREELPYLREKFNVSRIALFGSYARGEQREGSDIDILVEFEKPVGFIKFIKLENYLSEKLGVKVELVTPDALKPLIKPSIIREAVYV